MELYKMCQGNWPSLLVGNNDPANTEHLDCFLSYAAVFLTNVGNYYVCITPEPLICNLIRPGYRAKATESLFQRCLRALWI
jgi:hypothetical protein